MDNGNTPPSIAEYLSIEYEPNAPEFGMLPKQVSDPEFTILINNTNNELKCLLLGLLSHNEPRPPLEVEHELVMHGGTKVETTICSATLLALGRFSTALVRDTDAGLILTPFGVTAQSLAGHNLTKLSPLAPLSDIYGQQRKRELLTNPTFLKRILILVTLAKTASDVIPQAVVVDKLEADGIDPPISRLIMSRLLHAGIIELANNTPRHKDIAITLTTRRVGHTLSGLTKHFVKRDPDYLEMGRDKLQGVLENSDTVGKLVHRSLDATAKPKDKLEAVAAIIEDTVKRIQQNSKPVSSAEIYAALPDDVKERMDINTFTSTMRRVRSLPNLDLRFWVELTGKKRLMVSKRTHLHR
jgi:hypothetical protein